MVTKSVIPIIRKRLGARYRYNDSEARDIIQGLHRSRHRVTNINTDTERAKKDQRQKKANAKRADVRNSHISYTVNVSRLKLYTVIIRNESGNIRQFHSQ
jgi:hypothetical protein